MNQNNVNPGIHAKTTLLPQKDEPTTLQEELKGVFKERTVLAEETDMPSKPRLNQQKSPKKTSRITERQTTTIAEKKPVIPTKPDHLNALIQEKKLVLKKTPPKNKPKPTAHVLNQARKNNHHTQSTALHTTDNQNITHTEKPPITPRKNKPLTAIQEKAISPPIPRERTNLKQSKKPIAAPRTKKSELLKRKIDIVSPPIPKQRQNTIPNQQSPNNELPPRRETQKRTVHHSQVIPTTLSLSLNRPPLSYLDLKQETEMRLAQSPFDLRGTQTYQEQLMKPISLLELKKDWEQLQSNMTDKQKHHEMGQKISQLQTRIMHLETLHQNDFSNTETQQQYKTILKDIAQDVITKAIDQPKLSPKIRKKLTALKKNLIVSDLIANTPLHVVLEREKKEIKNQILETGITKKQLKNLWLQSENIILNTQTWNTINKTISLENNHQLTTLNSQLKPASKLRLHINDQSGNRDPFITDYQQKGRTSSTKKSTEHINNLYQTQLTDTDDNSSFLFSGIRSGSIAGQEFKKHSEERTQSIHKWAEEIITAAVINQIDQNSELIDNIKKGEPISLKMLSTSLLTPDTFRNITHIHDDEKSLQADQHDILHHLASKPYSITLYGSDNTPYQITIDPLDIATINPGVNELSLNPGISTLIQPWKTADGYSKAGLETLIGPLNQQEISGWTGDWLKLNPHHKKALIVRELAQQIRDIFNKKEHHKASHDPYKLVTRCQLLAHTIGVVPHMNCKSGKDRTGEADARTKDLATEIHLTETVPISTQARTESQANQLKAFMFHSGQNEVLLQNTCSPLYKTGTARKTLGDMASLLLH
ncbi:MAG: hypothetical protein HAW62_04545 [Endozoicomonadaceae bacterium]|nr:hypothetical protein [Endozoicomonadaceae bacterium]